MQWAVAVAAFLASAVEFVEAFTIVLVVGVTINWRSAIVGTLAAVAPCVDRSRFRRHPDSIHPH